MAALRVLVLHGPNLNLLGEREPATYGRASLVDVDRAISAHAAALGVDVECFQSNHEGALIDRLHAARSVGDSPQDGVLLNAGAFAHTSLALADAVRAVAPLPVVEVHLTNTVAREAFRREAVVGQACLARVEGFGPDSYVVALEGLVRRLRAAAP